MPALDTNVLVRLLVGDDAVQTEAARRYLALASADGVAVFVPVTVVLELEWVLRSRFDFRAETFADRLSALLESDLEFEAEPAVELALRLFRQGRAEFADTLHAALAAAAGRGPLLTFDKTAARLNGAELLR